MLKLNDNEPVKPWQTNNVNSMYITSLDQGYYI